MKKIAITGVGMSNILKRTLGVKSPSEECVGDMDVWMKQKRYYNCSDCAKINCPYYMKFDQSKPCEWRFPKVYTFDP